MLHASNVAFNTEEHIVDVEEPAKQPSWMQVRQLGVLAHMGTVSTARLSNWQIVGGRLTGNECFADKSGDLVDLSAPCLLRSHAF